MSDELRRALDDLAARAADEHTGHGGLPVPAMTDRAHRNRVRRTALVSGLVAVVLVAAGAGTAAVVGRDGAAPLPASTPTVTTPTVTTAPTTDATAEPAAVLPTGDTSRAFGVCGSVVGTATDPATDPDAGYQLDVTAQVPQGGEVTLSARLVPPGSATQGFVRASGPTSVVTHDGVVVAIVPTSVTTSPDVTWFTRADPLMADDLTTTTTHAVPVVCDDGSGTGQPGSLLPAGTYQVYALGELWTSTRDADLDPIVQDGTVDELVAATGVTASTAVSDPVTLTVTDEQVDQPVTVPTGAPTLPDVPSSDPTSTCTAASPATGSDFTLTTSASTLTVAAGAEVTVDLTTTFQGAGRFAGAITLPRVEVWQDGVLLGYQTNLVDTALDADHGTSTTSTITFSTVLTCADGMDSGSRALTAGTYELRPTAVVVPATLTASDGSTVWTATADDPDRSFVIGGTAITLVVG